MSAREDARFAIDRLMRMADYGRIDMAYDDFSHPAITMIADVRKVLALLAADAGPGWRVVPVEPTTEMVKVGRGYHPMAASIWSAMLSAAPEPDAKEEEA